MERGFKWTQNKGPGLPSTFSSVALTLWNLLLWLSFQRLLQFQICTIFCSFGSYTSRVSSKWSHTRLARSPHISGERDDPAWVKGTEKWTHLGIPVLMAKWIWIATVWVPACTLLFYRFSKRKRTFQLIQEKKNHQKTSKFSHWSKTRKPAHDFIASERKY